MQTRHVVSLAHAAHALAPGAHQPRNPEDRNRPQGVEGSSCVQAWETSAFSLLNEAYSLAFCWNSQNCWMTHEQRALNEAPSHRAILTGCLAAATAHILHHGIHCISIFNLNIAFCSHCQAQPELRTSKMTVAQ